MEDALPTQSGRSLIDAALHRCATRPWQVFVVLWSMLFLASGAIALLGLNHVEKPVPVLRPEGIDYAQYIHSHKAKRGLGYDRSTLPHYDPARANPKCSIDVVVNKAGEPRLQANFFEVVGMCGWPQPSFSWTVFSAWDVTDPAQFERCIPANAYRFLLHDRGMQLAWENDARDSLHSFVVDLPGALMQLALPQILAATLVLGAGSCAAARARRRFNQRRCVACGHQLDPAGTPSSCPECGATVERRNPPRRSFTWWMPRSKGAKWRVAIVLLALLTWIGVQVASRIVEDSSLFWHRMVSTSPGQPHDDALTTTITYGWPVTLLSWQRQEWIHFDSGAGATPIPAEDWVKSHISGVDAQMVLRHTDPSVVTVIRFAWPWVVLQASLFILLAALLAGVEWIVCHFARRSRSQPS